MCKRSNAFISISVCNSHKSRICTVLEATLKQLYGFLIIGCVLLIGNEKKNYDRIIYGVIPKPLSKLCDIRLDANLQAIAVG